MNRNWQKCVEDVKKILLLNAHADDDSLCFALAEQYFKGAKAAGHEIKKVNLAELEFDLVMKKKFFDKTRIEADVLQQQELIRWCNQLVIVTPNMWWNLPALLKGYFDRVFSYGFASDYKDKFPYVIPLLKGRSARVIYTENAPVFIGWLFRGDRFWKNIKISILRHCGFKPVKRTVFGPVKKASVQRRNGWQTEAFKLGQKGE